MALHRRKQSVATLPIWCNDMVSRPQSFLSRFWKCRSGVAGAEMAMMVPLLLGLMYGSFELGNYFWKAHIVAKSVREGVRFAARQPFEKFSCSSADIIVGGGSTAADTALIGQIKNLTRTGQISGGTAKINNWADGNVSVIVSCPTTAMTTGIYTGMANAPIVKVSADNVAYPSLFQTLGFQTTGLTMSASAKAAVMGL
jgi:Flp pilus assembly protein TadG